MKRLMAYALAAWLTAPLFSTGIRAAVDPNKEYELDIVFWDKTDQAVRTWNWITDEYRKVRPNIKLNVKFQPHRGYENWFRTQFIAGTAPDMLQMFPRNYHKQGPIEGNLVPLKQFYFKPSAYSPSKRWLDDFYSTLMSANSDPYYGELWSVPMGVTSLRMYYNKTLFDAYGIGTFPETWTGFLATSEVIREKSDGKIVPLVANRTVGWLIYHFINAVLWERSLDWDTVIPDLDPKKVEKMAAFYNGTVSLDDELLYQPAKIMRDMYLRGVIPAGFSGLDAEQADNIFINGQAAMIQNGSWALRDYQRKIAGDFEFRVALMPELDTAYYSRSGGRSSEGMGTFGADICVTRLAEKRGNLDACIDLLQFYTSRHVVEDNPGAGGGFPAVRNVKVTGMAKMFKPVLYGARGSDLFVSSGVAEIGELESQARTSYIDGTITFEEYKKFIRKNFSSFMGKAADEEIKDHKMGIYKSCRAEPGFQHMLSLYGGLKRGAAGDTAVLAKLTAAAGALRMRKAAVTDRREETEKGVIALIGSYLKGNAAGFRHTPIISKSSGRMFLVLWIAVLLALVAALFIYLSRDGRYKKVLAYDRKHLYAFIFFSVLLLVIFNYFAAVSGIYHAFTEWDGHSIDEFIGLKNFIEITRDAVLGRSVINLVFLMLAFFIKMLPPIICSVILFHLASARMQYFFRVVFVLPMIIPWMVTMLIWKFLYQPEPYGVFNNLLIMMGMGNFAHNWLANPNTALGAIIFLGFPWFNTVAVLIYLAGLQNISESVYDAAKIDGAGAWQRFLHIELPLILRQIKINLVLGIVGTIQTFGQILIITGGTGGGAGGPLYSTTVPGLRMYIEAFTNGRMGYASAIGFLLFLTILMLTMINVKYIKPKD